VGTVLVACEYSGVVREEFRKRGHDAWSCDLLDTEIPGQHIKGDVLNWLDHKWDLVIAHPTCTRICNSGVRWLHERNLWNEMRAGAEFFCEFAKLDCPVAIENPVMHKYAKEILSEINPGFKNWPNPAFTVQPWQFGDNFKKRTCFWTKGLPDLVPTSDLDGSTAKAEIHLMSPGKDRGKKRSKTYQGIAAALAEQYGKLI